MGVIWNFIKTTFKGGLLFLVPVVILIIIIEKAMALTQAISVPIAKLFPNQSFIGMPFHRIISISVVLVICFLAGMLARTKAAKKFVSNIENMILTHVPGYSMIKGLSETIAGAENLQFKKVVIARIEDSWQLAFMMEDLGEGNQAAIFVPATPNPWEGSLYLMSSDRFRVIDMPIKAAITAIKQAGIGVSNYIKPETLANPPTD